MSFLKRPIIVVFVMLIALSSVSFTGCGPDPFVHRDGYPQYFSVAIYSMLGVQGRWEDKVEILEDDDFGRVMFSFESVNGLKDAYDWGYFSVLICQKADDQYTYFYPDYSFIYARSKEDISDADFSELKSRNDWGKELDESKMTRVRITQKREFYQSNDRWRTEKKALEDFVNYEDEEAYFHELGKDQGGRWLFYVVVLNSESKHERSYMVILNGNGSCDQASYVQLIDDIWDYQDQFKAFKELNNWEIHME